MPDALLASRVSEGMGMGGRTGAMAPSSVSSSTSSMALWFGFGGGGLMSVARLVSSSGSGAPGRALNMLLLEMLTIFAVGEWCGAVRWR